MKILLIKLWLKDSPSTRCAIKLETLILRRIIANLHETLYQYALALVATGQCTTAMIHLNLAITRGHLPSRALNGSKGVARDYKKAFELVEEGSRLGCHHCQGVMAGCTMNDDQVKSMKLSRMLACKSSKKGSRYGQCFIGELYWFGGEGTQAVAFFRLAAAQNLDRAQWWLGHMYSMGIGVGRDDVEALRWYQLAAAQGYPSEFVQNSSM
jgi:TPR repeat protein